MRYLILISSLSLCLLTAYSLSKTVVTKEKPIAFWTSEMRNATEKNEYRITISTPTAHITGLCILKNMNGMWNGTIINEFGLKVFDFQSNAKECKLMNVIPFMNKWYIKKEVASDLQFIIEIDNPNYKKGVDANRQWIKDTLVVKNKNEMQRFADGKVQYKNQKRGLTYTLMLLFD